MTLRVTVWNEYRHERQNEAIGAIYPKGIAYGDREPSQQGAGFRSPHRHAR